MSPTVRMVGSFPTIVAVHWIATKRVRTSPTDDARFAGVRLAFPLELSQTRRFPSLSFWSAAIPRGDTANVALAKCVAFLWSA